MNLYWLYDIPNWLLFLIIEAFFVSYTLIGSILFRKTFEKKLNLKPEDNATTATYMALIGVFYGITLGLIAVFTFENFNSVEGKVNDEASSLAGLYRDVSILEKPEKQFLKDTLKEYTIYVINDGWSLQRQGKIPLDGTKIIDKFQKQLSQYSPETEKDKIFYAQSFAQFNSLIEKRRQILNSVSQGLPASIWFVLMLGAFINILLTWLLVIENRLLDLFLSLLCGLLIGSLIFVIVAMDNPFRGEFSVTPDSFVQLLDTLMK
jgi:Protein of unknown function (DUF4239)